jgi:ketosteroid isomerase-like protein
MKDDEVLAELQARSRRDHLAWINGDASGYALPDDGTIFGGIGGHSTGGPTTAQRQSDVARQWVSGSGDVEFVNGGVSGDLAWLAFIERAVVRGEDAERRWELRVTEVFRKSEGGWERVHRHADPLVDRRPLSEVAALLD